MFIHLFTVFIFLSLPLRCLFFSLFLQTPVERWKKCLTDTSSFFEPILGQMIVKEIFPQQTKKLVGIHPLIPQAELSFVPSSFFFFFPLSA